MKAQELLKRVVTSKLGTGGIAIVFAYVVPKAGIACPICGNQGVHPWEWGSVVGI